MQIFYCCPVNCEGDVQVFVCFGVNCVLLLQLYKQTDSVWSKMSKYKNAFLQKHKKLLHKKTPERSRIQNDKMNEELPKPSTTAPPAGRSVTHGPGPRASMATVSQHTMKITKITKTQLSDQFLCCKNQNLQMCVLSRQHEADLPPRVSSMLTPKH